MIAGLLLALLLMVPLVPLADLLDGFLVTNPISPVAVLLLSLLLIWKYPSADRWTPTRYIYEDHFAKNMYSCMLGYSQKFVLLEAIPQ